MRLSTFIAEFGAVSMIALGVALPLTQAAAQSLPQTSPIQRMQAPTVPTVAVPADNSLPADANQAPTTPVAVRSVIVEGAGDARKAEIEALTAGLAGTTAPLKRIEEVRLDILRHYRGDGYPLVVVDVRVNTKTGTLIYRVTEGRIAEIRIEPDIGPAADQVRRFLQHLVVESQSAPVRAKSLERWILLAQDVPGVSLQTLLSPSETEPGAMVLTARVQHQVVSASLAMDNRAYKLSGPEEALLTVSANSLTTLGERTELSLYRSILQPAEIFGQASVEAFAGGSGLKIRLYGGAGHSTPRGDLARAGYLGINTVFGAEASYPLIKERRQVLDLKAVFDANESDIEQGQPAARSSFDSVRTLRIGADYVLADQVAGRSYPGLSVASFRLSRGVPALGASRNGQLASGRQGAHYDFTKLNGELSRDQTLFALGDDTSITFYTLAAGQWSSSVLPSAEQFLLGGMRFTRGFYSGEVAGDNAVALTGELRLNTRFTAQAFGTAIDLGTQFYGFYDWGQTFQNQAVDPSRRVSSYGAGVRMSATQRTEFDLEMVRRETRVVNSSSSLKPLPETALYWRVVVKY